MKLARVTHDRCNEYIASTYIMVPDALTEEQLDVATRKAREKYDEDTQTWHAANPPPPRSLSWRTQPKDKTVGDLLKEEAMQDEERKEHERKRRNALQNFASYLLREIPGAEDLWDAEALEATVVWGHQHGRTIDYGEWDDPDLKGAARSGEEK